MLLLEIKKKESKKQKVYRNEQKRLTRFLGTMKAGRARVVEEKFTRKLINN